MTNEKLEYIYPLTQLKVSKVIKDQRPLILQDIWCRKRDLLIKILAKMSG
jgi:hypothetical protein